MLSSLNTTHDEEEEEDPAADHHHHLRHGGGVRGGSLSFIPPSNNHTHQLLINCAELTHHADFPSARRLLSLLSSTTTPYGDSTDRLAHQFANALSLRINHLISAAATTTAAFPFSSAPPPPLHPRVFDTDAFQSSYLSLNQITPFLRFSHLTANQAILEAVDGHRSIHILDFDTMHGVQWPPLMQAIAERSDPNNPPSIRITGTGSDIHTLRRTGDRLKTFADTLGLKFQFQPLLLRPSSTTTTTTSSTSTSTSAAAYDLSPSSLQLHPGEALAVNCVLFLHKLLKDDDDGDLRSFLRAIKAMNPAVVTVAEREASHNSPIFLQRFIEALEHYTAVFESLEATLPPNSRERLVVEQVWFGREIADLVAGEGRGREERHERFERWEQAMRSSGFGNVPLSPFALSQAKLLLRLHYPSEGYQLQMVKDSFFLGWQNRPLFSVSSWH